jgi:hypothetical protein
VLAPVTAFKKAEIVLEFIESKEMLVRTEMPFQQVAGNNVKVSIGIF